MKTIKLLLATFIAFVTIQAAHAQPGKENILNNTKTQIIKVYGECGMCKTRIEKAASAIDGVKSATWDEDTKNLTIKYSQFNNDVVDAVQASIAAAGHDTEKYSAADMAYQKLPECCHYNRKDAKQ